MVQSTESHLGKNPTGSYGANPAVRCPFFKPKMRAVLMMVTNILGEHSFQQVSPTASDPPLRDAILPWTSE
jgi:hypothetical protein